MNRTQIRRTLRRKADMELLLGALACGAASFDGDTHELRFNGLRYSCTHEDWTRLCDVAGRDRLKQAIARFNPNSRALLHSEVEAC